MTPTHSPSPACAHGASPNPFPRGEGAFVRSGIVVALLLLAGCADQGGQPSSLDVHVHGTYTAVGGVVSR